MGVFRYSVGQVTKSIFGLTCYTILYHFCRTGYKWATRRNLLLRLGTDDEEQRSRKRKRSGGVPHSGLPWGLPSGTPARPLGSLLLTWLCRHISWKKSLGKFHGRKCAPTNSALCFVLFCVTNLSFLNFAKSEKVAQSLENARFFCVTKFVPQILTFYNGL